jgi:predicted phage-related endonuclease
MKMPEAEFLDWLYQTPDRRGFRRSIGGSQIGAIVGKNSKLTAGAVWDQLLEQAPPLEESWHLDRGRRMEPIIADLYGEKTGYELSTSEVRYLDVDGAVFHSLADRIIQPPASGRSLGVLECKSHDDYVFAQILENGLDGTGYYEQLHLYMRIEGVLWGSMAHFNLNEWRLHDYDVEHDQEYSHELLVAGTKFWNEHVLTRRRPEKGEIVPVETIAPLRLGAEGVKWEDERRVKLIDQLKRQKAELDLAKKAFESTKSMIQKELEADNAEIAFCGSAKITWKEQTYSSIDRDLLAADGIDVERYTKRSVSRAFNTYFKKG